MRGVLLASFHTKMVLFRPGAWEPGPPARFAAAFGGGTCRISTLREAVPLPAKAGERNEQILPPKGGKRNDQIMYASAQPLDFLARTKTFRLKPVRGMTRLCLLFESETASVPSAVSGWTLAKQLRTMEDL
jgi:hypothetical protein